MPHLSYVLLCTLVLLASALALLEVGRRHGARHGSIEGTSALEAFIYSMMGLLLAFTFHGAAERFDLRRRLIIDEANAIGTAYRRVELIHAAAQPQIREAFRHYVDARIEVYRKLPDIERTELELARVERLKDRIWRLALAGSYDASTPSAIVVIVPALTEMFDAADLRTGVARLHPPKVIYLALAIAILVSSLLAGYGMGSHRTRSWLHFCAFVGVLGVSVYVILELEYPRVGLVREDAFDDILRDVRQSMR